MGVWPRELRVGEKKLNVIVAKQGIKFQWAFTNQGIKYRKKITRAKLLELW